MNGPIAANVIFFLLMCVKCLLMLSLTHFLGHDTHRHTHACTHARMYTHRHKPTHPSTHPHPTPPHPHTHIHTPTSTHTHTHTHTRSFFDTDTYTEKKFKNRTSSFHGQNFLRSKRLLTWIIKLIQNDFSFLGRYNLSGA